MKSHKILYLLLALVFVLGMAGCVGGPGGTPAPSGNVPAPGGEKTYADKITVSMSVLDAEKSGKTPKNEWFNKKFNVEWKYIPVTWGDWGEKVRQWVAAQNVPDLMWWDMKLNHTAEFRNWASQGAFREIPADLSKWPEMAKQREVLVSDDKVLTVDGKLYGWSAYRNNPEWLQNAYYPMFAYRRDWAKAVGLYKEGDRYTWEEAKAMIKKVQSDDPGKNGAGNTFGITSEAWAFPGVFMEILGYAEDRNGYIKGSDGKWMPLIQSPGFLEELKFVTALYREGYIWKDQMVVNGSEGYDNFAAGRSFMFLGNNSPAWFNGLYTKMLDSKIIASTDQVAPMIVFSPKDNKSFWLTQTEDYWTVTNFSAKVDDKKAERILDMWNWLLTEDGRKFRVAGIPDTDYTNNADGTMTIKWEKNPDGSYKSPYADQAFNEFTPPTLLKGPTETDRTEGYVAFKPIDEFMKTPDYHVHPLNWELNTFGGKAFAQYGSFSSDTTTKIKEILAASDDPATMWQAFLDETVPKMKPVIDELNAGLK